MKRSREPDSEGSYFDAKPLARTQTKGGELVTSKRCRRRREERVDIKAVTQTPREARLAVPSKRNPKTKVLCTRPLHNKPPWLVGTKVKVNSTFSVYFHVPCCLFALESR